MADDTLEYVIRIRGGAEGAVEVRKVETEIDKLGDKVHRTNAEADAGVGKWGRYTGALSKASKGIGAVTLAAVALGPALVPTLASAAAGVGALGAAFGPAGVAALGFGKIFTGQVSEIGKAATQIEAAQRKVNATYGPAFATQHAAAVKNLTLLNRQLSDQFGPGALKAVSAYQRLTDAKDKFVQSFNVPITNLMTIGLDAMTKALPIIRSLLMAAANAFTTLAREASKAIGGPGFRNGIAWMTREAGPGIIAFGHIVANLGRGFFDLLRNFMPMAEGMRGGMVRMSAAFADWARNAGTSGGFQKFLAYARAEGPRVLAVLGQMVTAIAGLGPVLAGAGGSSLFLLSSLSQVIQWLEQWPVVGQFVGQLIPFLIIAAKLSPALGLVASGIKYIGTALTAAEAPFLLTPLGIALMALVLVAVLIATHWQDTQRILGQVWGWMRQAGSDTAGWIERAFDNMVNFVAGLPNRLAQAGAHMWDWMGDALKFVINHSVIFAINAVILGINALIQAAYDSPVGFALPGGLKITPVPYLAEGGIVRTAGHAVVGESGPELLSLPQGAQVSPLAPGSLAGHGIRDIVLKVSGRELARINAAEALAAQAAGL